MTIPECYDWIEHYAHLSFEAPTKESSIRQLSELPSIWKSIGKLEIVLRRCKYGSSKWMEYDKKLTELSNQAVDYGSSINMFLRSQK